MEPELNRSVSEKMSKHTEMPFMKVNGKCQITQFLAFLELSAPILPRWINVVIANKMMNALLNKGIVTAG
jgi:hypothetical protein